MNIRKKLTFQFVIIVASILCVSLLSIYYFSSYFRHVNFIDRLTQRAESSAKLLINTEEIDSTLLKIIDKTHPAALYKVNIAIYNKINQVIYTNKDTLDINITHSLVEQVKEEKKVFLKQNHFEIVGILFECNSGKYVIFAAAYDKYGFNHLKNLRNILFTVFFSSILLVLLIGWQFTGRALYPISRMINKVEKISISNIKLRLNEGRKSDELEKLAESFNKMLNKLDISILSQKKFISNASHELRTPLTVIKGQLEVALISDRNPEYYKNKIKSVLEEIENLIQTSNQLLVLTRVETDPAIINFKLFRIDELVWQSRIKLIKSYPENNIVVKFIDFPDDVEDLSILGNENLLEISIINLLDNACKFSNNKKVILRVSIEKTNIVLDFIDEGIGIEKSDLPHIFEPFYRSNNVNSFKGSGIGLSLVEKIIEIHKGKIEVKSEINKGTTFTVTLPIF